jgi:hypothetical protein
MEQAFEFLKNTLPGTWRGEGFSKFPTIEPTGYTEEITFTADADKQVIHYTQKAWYKNDTLIIQKWYSGIPVLLS